MYIISWLIIYRGVSGEWAEWAVVSNLDFETVKKTEIRLISCILSYYNEISVRQKGLHEKARNVLVYLHFT